MEWEWVAGGDSGCVCPIKTDKEHYNVKMCIICFAPKKINYILFTATFLPQPPSASTNTVLLVIMMKQDHCATTPDRKDR